jgi:hypothetical protein
MKRIILIIIVLFTVIESFAKTEAEIKELLEQRTTFTLAKNTTFEKFFTILKERYGIQAVIAPRGAGSLGITLSSQATHEATIGDFILQDVPLRRILRFILAEQDLTYVIDDGFLLITTKEEAQKNLKIKIYHVADLVYNPDYEPGKKVWVPNRVGGFGVSDMGTNQNTSPELLAQFSQSPRSVPLGYWQTVQECDFGELMDIIEAVVSPDSWGEGGEMMEFYLNPSLIVRQTDEVHEEIEQLLAGLRKNLPKQKNINNTSPQRRSLFRR